MDPLSLFDAAGAASSVAEPVAAPSPAAAAPAAVVPTTPTGPVLLALDGNSLAHRAFHAYNPIEGRDGLYGFLALLCAICEKVRADALVVGFDCRVGSRRRDSYDAYKANRSEKDPALYDLLDEAPTVLVELGVPVIVPAGWEADDVLGSAASTAEQAGWRCFLATSDRDAFGLISDTTTVLRLRSGLDNAVAVTADRLRADMGVAPEQYVEFAALRGDVSDNLPGIPGIGPSRAKALLGAFATVQEAVDDPIGCRSVLGKSLGQALIDDVTGPASVFLRNRELMSIRRDIPVDLDDCARGASMDRITQCLQTWSLQSLTTRVVTALGARPAAAPPAWEAPAG